MPAGEREPVDETAIEEMKGELIDEEIAIAVEASEITEEWTELSTPVDEEIEILDSSTNLIAQSDERATLEEELARLDARWARRSEPVGSTEFTDSTLDDLEESLDGIDL